VLLFLITKKYKEWKMKFKQIALATLLAPVALLAEEATLSSGDTAWMFVATALIMLMTPAGIGTVLWRYDTE
jgi:Amt family ammonium transporter